MNLIKKTLNNSWFWVSMGILLSVGISPLILGTYVEREDALMELASQCPEGFVRWENNTFEITSRFETSDNSLIEFEKRTESGCRPFDLTNVPRTTVDSLLNVHSVIHYTWIQGLMDLSKGILIKADTTSSTKPHNYR